MQMMGSRFVNVICCYGGAVGEGMYNEGTWYIQGLPVNDGVVSHWMPLPEPPKQGRE